MTAIRSLLFMLVFYVATAFLVWMALVAALFGPRPLQLVVSGWGWFHRGCCRILLGQKVRVIGMLPKEPHLYIFKHESMFETIDLLCLFARPTIAAKKELTHIPLWGWVAKRFGIIEIEREAGATAMRRLRKAAAAAAEQGRPICLFPEGTRVPHGEAPPLRSGFAGLYRLLGLPVIPVAVDSGLLSPRQSFLKKAGTITYLIGEPVPAGLPREEAEARVHAAINALNKGGAAAYS